MPNKKNGYNPPTPTDPRQLLVAVGCGKCVECRTQKARAWQIRLMKQLDVEKYAYFVTLTFDSDKLNTLCEEIKQKECNAVATIAVRRFLERWRKKNKKSVKHWLITELGHTGTERIHLHGLLFTDFPINNEYLQKIWQYGYCDTGKYVNKKTINYIIKYVTKLDNDHKGYEPTILCSAGLGKNYITEGTKNIHKYRPHSTIEYIRLPNGAQVNMPIYYRNKFYNEEEKQMLWSDRLDKNTIFVRGIECKNIDSKEGQKEYMNLLHAQQSINKQMGYGDDSKLWKTKDYNVTLKMLNKHTRTREEEKRARTC